MKLVSQTSRSPELLPLFGEVVLVREGKAQVVIITALIPSGASV